MTRKIRKHHKQTLPLTKPQAKENLYTQTNNIPLNIAQLDRISFTVLRNNKNNIRKIENVSYEICIDGLWEWIVRYDDHGGTGLLHRHLRVSLKDDRSVESSIEIKRYKNKDYELTWIINNIKNNYLIFRKNFLENEGLDLY